MIDLVADVSTLPTALTRLLLSLDDRDHFGVSFCNPYGIYDACVCVVVHPPIELLAVPFIILTMLIVLLFLLLLLPDLLYMVREYRSLRDTELFVDIACVVGVVVVVVVAASSNNFDS